MDSFTYHFVGAGRVASPRLWAVLLVSAALAIFFRLNDFPYWLVPLGIAALGAYFLARPPRRNYCVELTADELRVHLVSTTQVRYRNIASVSLHHGGHRSRFYRSLINALVAFNNLLGAGLEKLREPEPGFYSGVIVRFNSRVLVLLPFPPFILFRRSWVLRVVDPERLEADLRARLTAVD